MKKGTGERAAVEVETPDVPATVAPLPDPVVTQPEQVIAVRLSSAECAEIAAVYRGEAPVDRLGTLVHKMHLFGYRA